MTSAADTGKLRVAIIGGGLAGLLLALSFQTHGRENLDVDVYESAAELTEIGAGIGMLPRICDILKSIGIEDELLQITGAPETDPLPLHFTKGDQAEPDDVVHFPNTLHTFHRSILQMLLAKQIHLKERIHLSKRLASYVEPASRSEPIVLNFKDGTTATCDVLIGSDGIRSAVRRTMYNAFADQAASRGDPDEAERLRSTIEPVWSGQVAYRGLVAASSLDGEALRKALIPQIRFGKNKDVVSYPISKGETINVVGIVCIPGAEGTPYDGPWVSSVTPEEVAKNFPRWEPTVQTLLKSMENPLRWAIHFVRPLPTFVSGRVALVGDAAHAMVPHQGAGAGQAIEDGFVLATVLAHPSITLENLPEALKVYDRLRRPVAQNLQQVSRSNGMFFQLNQLGWENVSEEESARGEFSREQLDVLEEELKRRMELAMGKSSNLQAEREQVVKMIDALASV